MSAVSTNGTAAHTLTPVEYVRGLPVEDQEDILIFLIKEMIRVNGDNGLILVRTETEDLGYHVPPKAAAAIFEAYGPKFTPEQWAEFDERAKRVHEARPAAEVVAELRAQAEAMRRQTA